MLMLKQQPIFIALIASLTFSAPVFARGGHGMGMDSEHMSEFLAQYDSNNDGIVTSAEIQAARVAEFKQADTNANGTLEIQELQVNMESKQAEHQTARFTQADTDGNGQLSAEEFKNIHPGSDTEATTLLGLADQDKSGTLSQEELAVLESPQGHIWRHFAQLDSDGNGAISETEYTAARANKGPGFGGPGRF